MGEQEEFGSEGDVSEDAGDRDLPGLASDQENISRLLGTSQRFIRTQRVDVASTNNHVGNSSEEPIAGCGSKQQASYESRTTVGVLCIACKATLSKDCFSKAQLTKHRGSSKCKACLQQTPSA